MKTLEINWLDECDKCGSSIHKITTTHGSEDWLYDGDKVDCVCGQKGDVECDEGSAWVNWSEE